MSDTPAYKEAQHAYEEYRQRRVDIAANYSRDCGANSDRLVEELAIIARKYDLASTRVVTYAFGSVRPDFIGRVRRVLSASNGQKGTTGA